MPIFSQSPKRRVGALVILITLMIGFYFFYTNFAVENIGDPLILFVLLGFSIVLLISPIIFEPKRPPPPTQSSLDAVREEKPPRPILRNCPKCRMLLPGSVWKCPNCGTAFTEGMGLGKDISRRKKLEV